jgi:hypothetical protein
VRHNTMHYTRSWVGLALVVLGTALAACSKKEPAPTVAPVSTAVSRNNRLKFKGGERIVQDLAAGLALDRGEVCKELGIYDCKSAVHNIALGGVEPYVQTIYTPVEERTASTSNAVERIALSACHQRMGRDFANAAEALVFTELVADVNAVTPAKVEAVAKRLYRNLLSRDASADEVAGLVGFWNDLKTTEKEPARAFATYACFAIATTEEALFF